MTKTFSLPVCRKLSEMGIEVESEYYWIAPNIEATRPLNVEPMLKHGKDRGGRFVNIPAYQLDELPAVLEAVATIKGGSDFDLIRRHHHFLNICSLYAIDGSLGEGSEAERYLIDLIK